MRSQDALLYMTAKTWTTIYVTVDGDPLFIPNKGVVSHVEREPGRAHYPVYSSAFPADGGRIRNNTSSARMEFTDRLAESM